MPDPTDPLAAMVEAAADKIAACRLYSVVAHGKAAPSAKDLARVALTAAGVPALLDRLATLEGFVKSVALDGPWPVAGMAQDLLATLTQEDPDE